MKNKLKGFTLVELIVVMAIMGILMLAIMNMFKPIRSMYVDSTQFEAQRTAQSGVVQYITETVRFATDMGVYNDVATPKDAAKKFAEAYCDANGYDKTDTNNLNEIYKYAEIIIIDNGTYHYSKNYTGRLIRRKVDATLGSASNIANPAFTATSNANKVIVPSTTNMWRTALGESYYGENTYYITLDVSDKANGMLTVSVASTKNGKRDISQKGKETNFVDTDGNTLTGAANVQTAIDNNKIAVTRGGVLCRNLVGSSGHGVNSEGIYDTNYVAYNTKDAYIVFLNKDGKDAIEAAGLT